MLLTLKIWMFFLDDKLLICKNIVDNSKKLEMMNKKLTKYKKKSMG
jgi:hypothetical protein